METLLNRVTDPVGDPVTLAEAKTQLRVDFADDDTLIGELVSAATRTVEEMVGGALLSQEWALSVRYPRLRIYLPKTPVQSIDSITYYDRDETEQTANVADFHLFSDVYRAWVEPRDDKDWPDVFNRPDALTINFIAGYGAAGDVPSNLKHAILMLLTHWYEQRSAASGANLGEVPFAVETLVGLDRRGWFKA